MTALSVVGLVIHQFQEFPGQYLYNLSIIGPMAAIAALLVWFVIRYQRGYFALLLYTLIHLIGGVLSVFPLAFLPFVPEQSPQHYISHLLYALCQLPLIYLTGEVVIDNLSSPKNQDQDNN